MLWRLFVASLLCVSAWGQGLGTITGAVGDRSGAVIPSARVTATEVETGASRAEVTSGSGYYVLSSVRPRNYTLTVTAPGFRRFTENGIALLADQSATINAKLEVGSATETMTVEATGAQVDTTTSTIRQVVDSQRMATLPLNGRNAAQLTVLVAGAVNAPNQNADQGPTKTFPAAVTVSTNGSRQNWVSYLLDGVPNVDILDGVNTPFPAPDALQEFSVQTSNYSAEFGLSARGVVNILTKSRSNVKHRGAFR